MLSEKQIETAMTAAYQRERKPEMSASEIETARLAVERAVGRSVDCLALFDREYISITGLTCRVAGADFLAAPYPSTAFSLAELFGVECSELVALYYLNKGDVLQAVQEIGLHLEQVLPEYSARCDAAERRREALERWARRKREACYRARSEERVAKRRRADRIRKLAKSSEELWLQLQGPHPRYWMFDAKHRECLRRLKVLHALQERSA